MNPARRFPSKTPLSWILCVVAAAALAAAAPSVATAAPTGFTSFEKDRGWFVRHDAPQPLSGKTFESGYGQACRLSDLAGKPLLVHFWGSWCPPCLEELPSINRLQGLLWNEGLPVVPLSRDSGGPDKVRAIFRQLEIGRLYGSVEWASPEVLENVGSCLLADPVAQPTLRFRTDPCGLLRSGP